MSLLYKVSGLGHIGSRIKSKNMAGAFTRYNRPHQLFWYFTRGSAPRCRLFLSHVFRRPEITLDIDREWNYLLFDGIVWGGLCDEYWFVLLHPTLTDSTVAQDVYVAP